MVERLRRYRAVTIGHTDRTVDGQTNYIPHPHHSGRPHCNSTQDRFLRISTLCDRSISSTTLRRQLMTAVHVNLYEPSSRVRAAF